MAAQAQCPAVPAELADFDAWLGTLKVGTRIVIAGDRDVDQLDYSRRGVRCHSGPGRRGYHLSSIATQPV